MVLTYPTAGIDDVRLRVLGVEVSGPEAPDVLLTVREDFAHLMVNDYPVPADSALEPVIYSPEPCHDVLVFELPLAWTGKTAARLLVLPARGETLSSAWTLWWERSTNSFSAVGESGLFGRRGELNTGLSQTGLFYLEGGLDLTFTSPDDDLDDMPLVRSAGASSSGTSLCSSGTRPSGRWRWA